MNVILLLTVILFLTMLLIGGMSGVASFLGLIFNFFILFLTVILISLNFPYIWITLISAVIILLIIIYLNDEVKQETEVAFSSSLIVLGIVVLLIFFVNNWGQFQGFTNENSEELEGMSLLVGFKFYNITIAMTILSSLGAISEAAIAVASGLREVLERSPFLSPKQLFIDGIKIGREIIGTALNTLFFGFFGGYLALFIWFLRLNYSLGAFFNNKIFVGELVMTLISVIGVNLVIPMTVLLILIKRLRLHDKNIK